LKATLGFRFAACVVKSRETNPSFAGTRDIRRTVLLSLFLSNECHDRTNPRSAN
jgi:hypothetical protein